MDEQVISLAGGQDEHRSKLVSPQVCINLVPEIQNYEGASSGEILVDLAGQEMLHENLGALRGRWPASNGRVYIACANKIFELRYEPIGDLDIITEIGTIGNGLTPVSMCDNGKHLVIVDGANMYSYKFSDLDFKLIPPSSLPFGGATHIVCVSLRFKVNNKIGTPYEQSRVYFSDILPDDIETAWPATNYYTAEGRADPILSIHNRRGTTIILGTETTEAWVVTKDRVRPFARASEGEILIGTVSPWTASIIDDKLAFLASGEDGQGKVMLSEGLNFKDIADIPTAQFLQGKDISSALCWSYADDGHSFFLIHFASYNTTLVYDLKTGKWHRRESINSIGEPTAWNCLFGGRYNGKIFVGTNNGVALLDPNKHTDALGNIWISKVRTAFYSEGNRYTQYHYVRLLFDTGKTEYDSVPKGTLRWSPDGYTWGNTREFSIGNRGEYNKPITMLGLGMSRGRAWEITLAGNFPKTILYMVVAKEPLGVV